jgi:hypothetical protein
MSKGLLATLLLVAIAALGVAPTVQAQEHGTIQALATVVSALNVLGVNNLNFGTVTPGLNKSVPRVTVGLAGEWEITGTVSAEVTLDLTLPDQLYLPDSSATMIVQFSNTDAAYDDGSGGGQGAPSAVINPNGPITARLGIGGQMSVWIGGTVRPTISQTGGNYAADIILTVAYTGS